MKTTYLLILSTGLMLLCSCTMFYSAPPESSPAVAAPKPLAVPIGKNWQIVEEPPQLSDGSRLPFQTEQSLKPEVARPVSPGDNRTIETNR